MKGSCLLTASTFGDERITVVILKVGGYKVFEGSPVGLAYFVPAPFTNASIGME